MRQSEALKAFRDVEENTRNRNNGIICIKPERPATVGKHEAKNWVHLENVLAEADGKCPRAADTIRWLLWHEVLNAQWAMQMVEMIETESSKEK